MERNKTQDAHASGSFMTWVRKGVYSKKNVVRQLASIMLAHGVDHAVLCPGSRNAPIVQTFASHPDFRCFCVTDERSAGFFALGLILRLRKAVAVCCTSGTALLNLGSAVAEAFYQELPLLVLSADRPEAWIGQLEGQTIPQREIFRNLTKYSVSLAEGDSARDHWHVNRSLNQAMLSLSPVASPSGFPGGGPVHVNIPLDDPLFGTTKDAPVPERIIRLASSPPRLEKIPPCLAKIWQDSKKRLFIAGQRLPEESGRSAVARDLSSVAKKWDAAVVAEHTANLHKAGAIHNPDMTLAPCSAEQAMRLSPDLLVTFGGHIISKRLKRFLREHPPRQHWHISPDRSLPDTFFSLSTAIETLPESFFSLLDAPCALPKKYGYAAAWQEDYEAARRKMDILTAKAPFTDILAVKLFMEQIPPGSALHLANSSAVRNAQLFPLHPNVRVYCNRGTSGIDGCLSTAAGYAALDEGPVFSLIGDLGFFYDLNALWNRHLGKNLRILLLNNGGGCIFHTLPGLKEAENLDIIAGHHATSARHWAKAAGLIYLYASTKEELEAHLPAFCAPPGSTRGHNRAVLLEASFALHACSEFHLDCQHHLGNRP